MPFNFSYVCDLLDTLEKPYLRDAPYLPDHLRHYTQKETIKWFKRHRDSLNDHATHHGAVMGMLRPESWSDRVYGWDQDRLEPLLSRFLRLTRVQRAALYRWKTEPHTGDLAAQVGRIMKVMKGTAKTVPSPNSSRVTIETLDTLFLLIASQNKGSSLEIQSLATTHHDQSPIDKLREIYAQVQPREAKWLTRLLLKTTDPVTVPTDFGIASFQSQLPNCIKVHIALPTSAPPILQVGGSGLVKPSPMPKQLVIPPPTSLLGESPPPRWSGSPETNLCNRIRGTGTKNDFKSMEQRVSRPGQTLQKWNAPLPQLPPSTPGHSVKEPILTNHHLQLSDKKTRLLSRKASPGLLVFQRGILQHSRPTKISSNFSMSNAPSELAWRKDVTLNFEQPQKEKSLGCPTFQLSTSQKRKREADGEIPTPSKIRLSQSSHLELLAPQSKTTSQVTKKIERPFRVHVSPTTCPQETVKPILPRTATSDPPSPERPLSNLISVVQKSGSESRACSLTDSTCLLAACIFLIPSNLSAAIRTWIFTKILPDHACLYITSVEHLAHPSLPRRCPVTNMKYRRIVLIEPKDKEESGELLQQVENLDLTRSQGRKYWCEVFDWRLLEGVTKRESGIEGSGANPWKKYWLTAV